jgi:hypothetical protein
MSFGFAGCHRSGKTTLAKLVAEDLKMNYFDASTTRVMREAGINAVGDVPIEQRMDAQEFLLKRFLQNLTLAPRPIITDRTPLDMIGYMLSEVTMHNTSPELGKRINNYVNTCLTATLNYFDTIIVIGPLAHYAADPTKPPPNLAYQRNVQFLIEGAAAQVEACMYIERLEETDLAKRRDYSGQIFHGRMAQLSAQAKTMRTH